MNAEVKVEPPTGLELLRQPFPPHQISKLPKPTKKQTEIVRNDYKKGIRCEICGGWHHPDVVHLDYVGHAALTDRLLDCDPKWVWKPMSTDDMGLPAFDRNGGLWISLTVCGVTRLGYGDADGKQGGNAVKEAIGDALRNAAMRFGAALDLWHKGDLHLEEVQAELEQHEAEKPKREKWDTPLTSKTALKAACKSVHAELERMAQESTLDDLEGYLTSPEYQAYIATALEHADFLLEGPLPPEFPPEYVQTYALEASARDRIALRGNQALENV